MVMSTDRPDLTIAVYRGRKTTLKQEQTKIILFLIIPGSIAGLKRRTSGS